MDRDRILMGLLSVLLFALMLSIPLLMMAEFNAYHEYTGVVVAVEKTTFRVKHTGGLNQTPNQKVIE